MDSKSPLFFEIAYTSIDALSSFGNSSKLPVEPRRFRVHEVPESGELRVPAVQLAVFYQRSRETRSRRSRTRLRRLPSSRDTGVPSRFILLPDSHLALLLFSRLIAKENEKRTKKCINVPLAAFSTTKARRSRINGIIRARRAALPAITTMARLTRISRIFALKKKTGGG